MTAHSIPYKHQRAPSCCLLHTHSNPTSAEAHTRALPASHILDALLQVDPHVLECNVASVSSPKGWWLVVGAHLDSVLSHIIHTTTGPTTDAQQPAHQARTQFPASKTPPSAAASDQKHVESTPQRVVTVVRAQRQKRKAVCGPQDNGCDTI